MRSRGAFPAGQHRRAEYARATRIPLPRCARTVVPPRRRGVRRRHPHPAEVRMTTISLTSNESIAPQRVRELFGIAMALIAIWLVAGLFTASEFYRRSIAQHGMTEEFIYIMGVQTVSGLIWATFTPVLIAIAERLPLHRPVLVRNALI